MTKTTIMVTGDLHLGVHPSRIPEELDSEAFSPGRIWRNIVDECVTGEVDYLVVTGDIVDRENQFFEAWGPFETGINDLEANDIPLVMVAGNHDAGVLAEFIDSMNSDNAHLLGEGGEWERVTFDRDDGPSIAFDGWSYPEREVRKNPLDEYELSSTDTTLFGLLHTELGRSAGPYAPVGREDLQSVPVDGWLLGHIHKPQIYSENPLILNPGSPQPLNPTETGSHGPWTVTIDSSGTMETTQRALSSLRYQPVEVDVSSLDSPESLTGKLKTNLESNLSEEGTINDELKLILARLTLTGRSEHYREFERGSRSLRESLRMNIRGKTVAVETIRNRVRPGLDLEDLAEGSSPVAVLADLLLSLENEDDEAVPSELLENVESAVEDAYSASTYEPLRLHDERERPGRDDQIEMLRKQARALLEQLLSQKESPV
jgi:DNA repair exonuclease SbcCD nuclease subunit